MRIAITGGTGFIGGHLARNLIQKGHKVNIISRGSDKRDTSIRSLAGATYFTRSGSLHALQRHGPSAPCAEACG